MNYARMAQVAQLLIEKNGRDTTLLVRSTTPLDAAKPWRGSSTEDDVAVTCKAVFDVTMFEDVEVRRGIKTCLIAVLSAKDEDSNEIDLTPFTLLTDGVQNWRIDKVQLIAPGDTDILWELDLKE